MSVDIYKEQFKQLSSTLFGNEWLQKLRQQALESFSCTGFPTSKNEEWKYTNIKSIVNTQFKFAEPANNVIDIPQLPDVVSSYQIIFANGKLQTNPHNLPAGISIKKMADAVDESIFQQHFAQLTLKNNHPFTQLNTAFAADGIIIELQKNAVIEKPIYIFYFTTENSIQTHTRNLIVAHENSQATLIEHFISASDHKLQHFSNLVDEIIIKQNAKIHYYKIIDDNPAAIHISSTYVEQKRDSEFKAHAFTFNGCLIRNNLQIYLAEEQSECELNGLYITNKRQHVDHHTRVDHIKPHCTSRENYKGIANDHSRAVFCGNVYVHPHAYKSIAQQTNKNLLLATTAEIDTKPTLEIFNDDIKCTHGATVGQLDEEALFYLCARGIDKESAQELLISAFAEEIIKNVAIKSLKDYLVTRIKNKISGVD